MAAGPDLFLKPDGTAMAFDEAVPGGRSVGVPGTLALLELAHRLHGRLPWADLVEAGGRTRRAGLRDLAAAGRSHRRQCRELRGVRHDARLFPGRRRQPARGRHARCVTRISPRPCVPIAAEGSAPLYRGRIGDALVATVRGAPVNPGAMTADDLARYRVLLREPVCRPYRAVEVCGMGPPSSGGVAVLQILGLVEHFDMAGLGPTADGFQALLEASKLAFADRNLYLADADFVRVPAAGPARPGLPDRPRAADPARRLAGEGHRRQPALARGGAAGT